MSTVIESNESAIPPEQKYFIEAAKRKRTEGTKQFEQIHFSENEKLRSLADDVFADHATLDKLASPVSSGDNVKFLILGAGMGGIVMAVKLLKQGITADQILLIETAGGVGGTWYWNRYPGLHCDVEAYCYLPFLEETGYMPKQKYVSSVEIRDYLEDVVKKFGLDSRILFRSQATGLEWDEGLTAWKAELRTHRGPQGKEEKVVSVHADFVTIATGLFPYPQVPKVPGLADFEGPMLHTARWNYDITGGSSDTAFPELEKLKGKRVAIVGTGATAIQVVPQLAKYAKELYIFQRTPSQVNTRGQCDTDATEWREKIAAKTGWQKDRRENFADHLAGHLQPGIDDLVDDGWTQLKAYGALIGSNSFGLITPDKAQEHIGTLVALDSEHNAKARERIHRIVQDNETAKKLTPWYPTWCKRPTFSDLYLETFNSSNVHLVDTDGKGIDSVTSKSIVANGQDYPIDILILSTGYRSPTTGGDPGSRMGINILGRNARRMADKWEEQGLSTLHGVCSNGFPNLFFQSPAQAAATANYSHVIDVLSEHIASIIAIGLQRASDNKAKVVMEPTAAAEDAWGMQIAQGAAFFSAMVVCTPSYLNLEGEALQMPPPDDYAAMMKKAKSAIWYKGLVDFSRMIEAWRSDGKLEGVEISVSA
ncbi:FAD/NAD(P)-binding domain-containing protein [Cucurbitaria berberidis CBS 394.84]|uniref:FAD/NAD(P)-binding domain-containing protein n=1 Tax=Cucurbitaria berberidis CBS 394.84 TaxID=1168544 RepID=A0A9P4GT38_9PLEO|nr:FAD/NAD(P)-binding domain-containing protein [Cucurbitaria berberidis CBS 394.84]KAF1850855.1 FAD/NAD(P)-binding domain-containing protein [Cucurbitaria berberidis CBS 394.84]